LQVFRTQIAPRFDSDNRSSLLLVISGSMFASASLAYAIILVAYLGYFTYVIILLNLGFESQTATAMSERR